MSIPPEDIPAPPGPNPASFWVQLRAIGTLLHPTLAQISAAVLPIGVYFAFDQGKEVLSMLGEALSFQSGDLSSAILFLLGNTLAGFAIWWTARMMLEFNWGLSVPPAGALGKARTWLQNYWPRVLGVAPILIIAAALFSRIFDYREKGSLNAQRSLFCLGILHLLAAGALLYYFHRRRRIIAAPSKPRFHDFSDRDRQSMESRIINRGLLLLALVTLLALWAAPHFVAVWLGTGAIFSLAAIAWVSIGSRFMFFRVRTGAPVFSLLVGFMLLNSCWMDNHRVRLSKGDHPLEAGPTVKKAFEDWRKSAATKGPAPKLRPVFIVATEGGGIRAAYWTALVLGAFQYESIDQAAKTGKGETAPPDFASHIFAISGVSGGSVGASVFDALLADQKTDLWPEADQILGQDHLAPLLGALLFPDALQRIIPFSMPCTDRGAVLERSWERAYRAAAKSDRLAQPFRQLWPPEAAQAQPGRHLPHLLLNSTMVQTGQRVIFSDLAITSRRDGGEFLDAVDAREVLFKTDAGKTRPWDVPVSTAAHASARFTYTNPAGKVSTGQRVVDGGYFENSGSVTALEVLRVIEAQLATATGAAERVIPVVIIISNDPERQSDGHKNVWISPQQVQSQITLGQDTPASAPAPEPAATASESEDFKKTKPLQFASELLSPPEALLATQGARGTLALREIYEHQAQAQRALKKTNTGATPPVIISVRLHDEGIPLPLGWSLSHAARGDMQKQAWSDEDQIAAAANILAWLKLAAQP